MRLVALIKLSAASAILAAFGSPGMAAEARLAAFMAVKGPAAQPIGHYEFCVSNRAECIVRSTAAARVHLTADRWNTLVAVNNAVNTEIIPVTDQEMFGRPEVWSYPTAKGDCEDLVLLKRRMLVEKGWPVGALLITVVRQTNGDGHAVLTVLTDRGDLVLDNLDAHISLWNATPYRYVKRQSEVDTGKWVSVEDGRAILVGSLKN